MKAETFWAELSLFDDAFDNVPKPYAGPLSELITKHRRVWDKLKAPAFSPATYSNGTRENDNVTAINVLGYDFDHIPPVQWRIIKDAVRPYAHCWYTTFSHLLEGPADGRYRLLLLLSRPLLPEEHKHAYHLIGHSLFADLYDKSTDDKARMFFLPSTSAKGLAYAEGPTFNDGNPLDVDKALDSLIEEEEEEPASGQNRVVDLNNEPPLPTARAAVRLQPVKNDDGIVTRNRHAAMRRESLRCARLGMEEEEIEEHLTAYYETACTPYPSERKVKVEKKIADLAKSAVQALDVPAGGEIVDSDTENALAILPLEFGEDAIALEFAIRHQGDLRYVAEWGKWFRWDGKVWCADTILHAYDIARLVCREKAQQLADYLKSNNKEPGAARKISNAQAVAAVIRLARTDPKIAATTEQWNLDDEVINTPAGVVNLRDGTIRAANPQDYITKITSGSPIQVTCPHFTALLDNATNSDKDLQDYLQRVAGYGLTGSTKEEKFWFLFGDANTGKSKYLGALEGVMGTYATNTSPETFMWSKNERHPTELASLHGARLVTASETERGRPWSESRIKRLTGRDPIKTRFMHQDEFSFLPKFKIFISGNYAPRLHNVDAPMKRRLQIVPFQNPVPEDKQLQDLPQLLESEYDGIMSWMVEGARLWFEDGLKRGDAVTNASNRYFDGEDRIGAWLADCFTEDAAGHVTITGIWGSWKDYCESIGEHPGPQKVLGEDLERRGYPRGKTKHTRGHFGLKFRAQPDE